MLLAGRRSVARIRVTGGVASTSTLGAGVGMRMASMARSTACCPRAITWTVRRYTPACDTRSRRQLDKRRLPGGWSAKSSGDWQGKVGSIGPERMPLSGPAMRQMA